MERPPPTAKNGRPTGAPGRPAPAPPRRLVAVGEEIRGGTGEPSLDFSPDSTSRSEDLTTPGRKAWVRAQQ